LQPENVEYMVSKVDLLISLKRYEEAWDILDAAMKRGVPKAALKEWIDKCK
jgi:predicted Zn-dependent protease